MKLNLKVGIFISDNTDLWLTDASYSGFGTDLDVIKGKFSPACVVQKIRETFPSEEYCGLNTLLFEQHLFEKCTIAMNCELYTLQINIYNLHVELNFNVHAVFSLSVKS